MNKTKHSIIIFILFSVSLSLSACHIPVIDKEITLPFVEKGEAEVMKKALEEIDKAQTMEIDSSFNVTFNLGDDKFSFLNDNIKKQILAFINNNSPKVLGMNNLSEENPEVQPILSGFPEKISLNYHVKGQIDNSDKANTVMHLNVLIDYALEGMSFEAELEIIIKDANLYIRFITLPDLINIFVAQFDLNLKDIWWIINSKEFEKLQNYNSTIYPNIDLASSSLDQKENEELKKISKELLKNFPILEFEERLADEKINDFKHYHYTYSLNKNNLKRVIYKALDVYNNDLLPSLPLLDQSFSEIESITDNLIGAIDGDEINAWINKKTFIPRKVTFSINIDLSNSYLSQETGRASNMEIAGKINYLNINKKISINPPAEYKSITNIITEQLEDARAKARDAKRASDVKQIAIIAEIHAANYGQYPSDSSEIEKFDNFKSPEYKNSLVCPTNSSYQYISKNNNQGYEIKFCLERKFNVFDAGKNSIVTGGEFINQKNTNDSDQDGLSDEEELKIYNTNPMVKDTDHDGYSDGDEVKNGYNPNGDGKLSQ